MDPKLHNKIVQELHDLLKTLEAGIQPANEELSRVVHQTIQRQNPSL